MATKTRRVRSNDDLVVAGEGADGHGVLTTCRGDGALVRSLVVDLARRSGITEEWMPPAKEAKVQLTRAVRAVAQRHALNPEQEKRRDRQVVEARDPSSRWYLISATATGLRAGDKFGDVALTVTLFDDEQGQGLEFDPPESPLAIAVREEYDRLVGAELLQASDITGWLADLYKHHLGGVRYGGVWYIPRTHRAIAEQIVAVFWGEQRYGDAWFDPPLPVASSAQLSMNIANGLIAEVSEQLALLEGQRRKLRAQRGGYNDKGVEVEGGMYDENGELVEIGHRAAESFMVRFFRVRARVDAYAALLGPEKHRECHNSINDAMVELDMALEGGVTNADGSFRDIEAEEDARIADAERAANETSFAEEHLDEAKPRARVVSKTPPGFVS